jgi:hypothetical protein
MFSLNKIQVAGMFVLLLRIRHLGNPMVGYENVRIATLLFSCLDDRKTNGQTMLGVMREPHFSP